MARPVFPLLLLPLALAATAQAKPAWVPAAMDRVLLYSTQARVHRTATVPLAGAGPAEAALADLPPAAIPDTVRVACKSAEVVRVTVIQSRGELPKQVETRELVAKIEAATDKLRDLETERTILDGEQRFIRSLTLRREPNARRGPKGPEGLFAEAWRRTLTWMEARSVKIEARTRAIADERRKLGQELHALRVKAREVDPASMNRLVSRVVATLKGRPGRHKVAVSYRVGAVRWVPAYDLRYVPSKRLVEATYYAVVNQSTGEDWKKARMRFSTGTPTQLLAIPELPTWTLGRKRDFTPTPQERVELAPRPWVAPAPPVVTDPVLAHLRQVMREGREVTKAGAKDRDGDGVPDTVDQPAPAKQPPPAVKYRKKTVYDFEDDTVEGELVRPDGEYIQSRRAPGPMPTTPAPAKPEPAEEALAEASVRPSYARTGWAAQRVSRPTVRQEALPWTDVGYRPPSLHPDLPAAAAQGYRFTLYAPGRHSIPASGARQRVPLIREQLKVKPIYRVIAGLSKKAYLVAEVKNTTGRPILRGHANLFAGAMFSGRSWLNTALPGKTIKLPLGVDDAIKVERHIRQKTVVQGTFFKDDVTEYTVAIEIANHHRYPIEVELEDQVPVKLGRKIEIKAFSATPKLDKPDDKGLIRWKGTIKGRKVQKLAFTFQLVRPKDWEVRQHDG